MTFLLPYIIYGQPAARNFVKVSGDTISAAAAAAEIQLREKYTKELGKRVCVGVAEVDFTFRNRDTGEPIPQPAQQPNFQPRRRRRAWRRW